MAKWLKENALPVDFDLSKLTRLQITVLAETLRAKHQDSIDARSFDGLLADKENMPPELTMTISWVRKHPELHDKFWRYLELFSNTVK